MEDEHKRSGIRCSEHPDAPHGFMRDASHSAGRYVCECESWEPPKNKPMTRDEWKEWLAESWDEAQARASTEKNTTMIKTWQERCEEHPDHEGIVTERMIRNRMQEEIDELRQAIEKVAAWMMERGYATGHGDSVEDLLQELEWQIREQEREACAAMAEAFHHHQYDFTGNLELHEAIRARGEK